MWTGLLIPSPGFVDTTSSMLPLLAADFALAVVSGVEGDSVSTRALLVPERGVILALSERTDSSAFRSGERVCCRKERCEGSAADGEVMPAPAKRGVSPCAGRVRRFELRAGVSGFDATVRVLLLGSSGMLTAAYGRAIRDILARSVIHLLKELQKPQSMVWSTAAEQRTCLHIRCMIHQTTLVTTSCQRNNYFRSSCAATD